MSSGDSPEQHLDQALAPQFLQGIELFNKKEFFDCHEVLEEYWKSQQGPDRELTQGIIQIAVAYYHALKGNRKGAIKLFNRGLPRIKAFLPEFKGIEIARFVTELDADLALLEADLALLEATQTELDATQTELDAGHLLESGKPVLDKAAKATELLIARIIVKT